MEEIPLQEEALRRCNVDRAKLSLHYRTLEPEEKKVLRDRLVEAIELAFSDPSYADLRQELLNAGYVYVETSDFILGFFRDFDRAISVINRFGLEYLWGLNEILYNRALQERVLPALRATVDKLRMEGKSVEEEILAIQEFAREHSWIPGLDLPETTQQEIEVEREVVRDPIPMCVFIRASLQQSRYTRIIGMNDLLFKIIPTISPLDIFRLLRELHDNYVVIPRELAKFCETGLFTADEITIARQYLQKKLEDLKDFLMCSR